MGHAAQLRSRLKYPGARYIKRLGRFESTGCRITRDRTNATCGIGWEFPFVAIDDRSPIPDTQI